MTEITQVPVGELDDNSVLLDVREPNEFEAGHAPGAISIPLGELRQRVAEVPEEPVLHVICKSGARSLKAAEFLAGEGRDVANVEGGTTAWFDAGKPLVTDTGEEPRLVGPSTPPPASV